MFKKSKKLLAISSLLVHYDPKLPLILACDASAYGIGAVLAHQMPDGYEKPIGYASEPQQSKLRRTILTIGEERPIFGLWHQEVLPLCVWSFVCVGERSKTPTGITGRSPPQASAHVRRWYLYLSIFEYTLKFRKTEAHANADALSRYHYQ